MKNYSINAKGSQAAELLIYGDIGESWWAEESVTAKGVVTQLQELDVSELTVCINSYGGSVSDGLAIYNALRNHQATVKVRIDGVAVSIASLIAMAGDVVEIAENAMFMIHAPWGSTSGNAKEMRKYADLLDTYATAMASSYVRKSGQSNQTIMNLLTDGDDHWFTAEESIAMGFADVVIEDVAIAASGFKSSKFMASGLQHVAETLKTITSQRGSEKMTTETIQEIEAAVMAKERERVADIRSTFSRHMDLDGVREILDACIDDNTVTPDLASKRLLAKIGEGKGPLASDPIIYHGGNYHHERFRDAATDALMMRGGLTVKDAHPAAQDIRGKSVVNIAAICLEQGGRSTRNMSANETIQAALTGSDFPLLLANTANKSLMLGYEDEPASHRMWTRPVDVRDFKPQSRVAISEAPALTEIKERGEYLDGVLSERAESYQIATYGRMLSLSRQMMINDDLDAFTRIPRAFGASAARLEADKVYNDIIIANPTMSDGVALFHANHKNLMTAAEISIASLSTARAAMRKQKGIAGTGVLNIVPRYLIVPAELEGLAEMTIASLVDPTKTNETPNLQWIRSLELVVDPRLDADSTTAWYLAASTSQIDTVEIAYLEGQRGVFTENHTKFESDEFRMKARLDFAAAAIDWIGLVKNPGA